MSSWFIHLCMHVIVWLNHCWHFTWVISSMALVISQLKTRRRISCSVKWGDASRPESYDCIAGSDILRFIAALTQEPAISAGFMNGEYVGRHRISWPSDKVGGLEWARALSKRRTKGESTRVSISERICAKLVWESPDAIVWWCTNPSWELTARQRVKLRPLWLHVILTARFPTDDRPFVLAVHTLNPNSSRKIRHGCWIPWPIIRFAYSIRISLVASEFHAVGIIRRFIREISLPSKARVSVWQQTLG